MRGFWRGLCKAISLILAIIGVGSIIYGTVPEFKSWVDTDILKQEQVQEDNTAEIIAELTASLEEANTQIEVKTTDVENLTAEKNSLEQDIAELELALETSTTDRAELQTQLNARVVELEQINAEIQALEAEIEELETYIAELESCIEKDPNKTYVTDLSGTYVLIPGNGFSFLSGNSSTNLGLWLIGKDYSVTKIYDKGYNYNASYSVFFEDGSAYITNGKDAVLFMSSTKTVKETTNYFGYSAVKSTKLSNGNVLMQTGSNTDCGLHMYCASIQDIITLCSTASGYVVHELDETFMLLSAGKSNSQRPLYLVNKFTGDKITITDSCPGFYAAGEVKLEGNIISIPIYNEGGCVYYYYNMDTGAYGTDRTVVESVA